MRKDVKLGFAIGGVLLAVAIVFALVNTSHTRQPVDVAGGSDGSQVDTTLSESGKTDANKPAVVKNDTTQTGKVAKPDQNAKVEPTKTDPIKVEPIKTDTAKTDQPESRDIFGKSSTNWEESLKTGTPVPLMAGVMGTSPGETAKSDPTTGVNTPKPAGGSTVPGINFANTHTPTQTPTAGTTATHTTQGDADDLIKTSAAPAGNTTVRVASPDTRTATTHTIKNGETFVTIAAAYYGNGKYYKLIAAANPKVDPTHLKIGQVITLPAFDAKAETAKSAKPAPAPTPEAPIDAKAEYRVQSGDNLHRICIKLYGDAKQVDALYDLNKAKIGSDPAKLKLGMVLKLPMAPTAAASR